MSRAARAKSFETNLLSWIIVSHMLTADLVADLAHALVKCGGEGAVRWDSLFEEQLSGGPPHLANFLLRYAKTGEGVRGFLQSAIWTLVAVNDLPIAFGDNLSGPELASCQAVRYAFELARQDLVTYGEFRRSLGSPPEAMAPLLAAYDLVAALAESPAGDWISEVENCLPQSPGVLRAALLKHLGDLCLDLDRPHHAQPLYGQAAVLLSRPAPRQWVAFQRDLSWIVYQSEAATRRDLEGPQVAADALLSALQNQSLATAPVLHVNAAEDAFYAEVLGSDTFSFPNVQRTQVLIAPHLVVAHDLSTALGAWRRKEWRGASRYFWATLRRQIALGSASDARRTKTLFGLCIFDDLTDSLRRDRRPDAFAMAARLVLEGGDAEIVTKADWSRPLLAAYLTEALVRDLLARADAHPGARSERRRVLISLFAEWLIQLPAAQKPLAAPLLDVIAAIARDEPFSMLQGRGLAGESLKALERIAEHRPELATTASAAVADAIIARLSTGEFRPAWAALDAAYAYAEVFAPLDLRRCIEATLTLLQSVDPSQAAWPVIQPALGLLSDEPAQSLWHDDPALGQRCAAAIIRFGLGARSENVRLMFLLKDVAPYLVLSSDQKQALDDMVQDLRHRVYEINSSAVSWCIAGLLEAPGISRREGVNDALAALRLVMESAERAPRSMGLPLAYQCLLQLVQEEARLRRDLGLDNKELRNLLGSLLPSVLGVWRAAAQDPLVFTSFAIPTRTTPDPVIVHNWTFASMAFAGFLGAQDDLEPALANAEQRSELGALIAVGRAVSLSADPKVTLNPETICAETEDAFYAALGQRLVLLRAEPDAAVRHTALEALTEQCLRLGPHGLDAAVFNLAAEYGSNAPARDAIDAYRQRLSREETLKFSLGALLNPLQTTN